MKIKTITRARRCSDCRTPLFANNQSGICIGCRPIPVCVRLTPSDRILLGRLQRKWRMSGRTATIRKALEVAARA